MGDHKEKMTSLLESLPHMSAHTYLQLNGAVETLQVGVLHQRIGEDVSVSSAISTFMMKACCVGDQLTGF